jgi:hypothetical protein
MKTLNDIIHSDHFLRISGALAAVAFFVREQVTGVWHDVCLVTIGLGIFLGTWSTTTRQPILPNEPRKNPDPPNPPLDGGSTPVK